MGLSFAYYSAVLYKSISSDKQVVVNLKPSYEFTPSIIQSYKKKINRK